MTTTIASTKTIPITAPIAPPIGPIKELLELGGEMISAMKHTSIYLPHDLVTTKLSLRYPR